MNGLIKNKIFGTAFILLGIVSIWMLDGDVTPCLVFVPFGTGLILTKSNWIFD